MPFSIGAPEFIILVLILIFLFGGKKIPEFFKGLGDSVKEFKKAVDDDETRN